jgi:hypothetical protein
MSYVAMGMAFVLMGLMIYKPSPEAAQVLMLGVPALLGIASLWTKFVNDAELRHSGK